MGAVISANKSFSVSKMHTEVSAENIETTQISFGSSVVARQATRERSAQKQSNMKVTTKQRDSVHLLSV
jgi:hypothetical protein